MKRLLVAVLLIVFLGLSAGYSSAIEIKSDSFQKTMATPSPLSPPEKITSSSKNLVKTSAFKAGLKRRSRLDNMPRGLKGPALVTEVNGALSVLSNIKSFIFNRQKSMLARTTNKSKERLDDLTEASAQDLEDNFTNAEIDRAKTVARADVKKTTDTTVAIIKTDTQVQIIKSSLRQAEASLRKKGLSQAAKRRLIKKINSLKNQITKQYNLLTQTKTNITNTHSKSIKSAEDKLLADRKAAEESHEINLKAAEAAIAEEAALVATLVNKMAESDMKTRQELRLSIAKRLTRLSNRVISLGSPEKPKLLKPKNQRVSKNKKVKIKKKALRKAQKVGKKRLRYYRKLFYSRS